MVHHFVMKNIDGLDTLDQLRKSWDEEERFTTSWGLALGGQEAPKGTLFSSSVFFS